MKLLFYLGHPAHYHLFKNAINHFKSNNSPVHILIKRKDVLEELLDADGHIYSNIFPNTRGASIVSMTKTILKRNYSLAKYCLKTKPDLLIGTSVENSHIGKLLNIPSINVNEDDHDVVPLYSQLSYPLSNTILSPTTCSTGKWEFKTIHYKGYHELAYLHPNNFMPSSIIAKKYVPLDKPFFLIRFAKLTAHHDRGIRGIDDTTALQIVEKLIPHGNVFITSEKKLEKEFEQYRIDIEPRDMHHVMTFAKLYIGDSQTMAAEAGVLGVPFIRYNDFAGRIGYLKELEETYGLGFGISPPNSRKLLGTIEYLLKTELVQEVYQERRIKMLNEKIDVNQFLIWFIQNFPNSKHIMRTNPDFQSKFISRFRIEKEIEHSRIKQKELSVVIT
ncbi:MAG: DUF354 domain-containing protein [Bacteroidales bacterium]|nr:DUF354 domain-containing protein [Bacteroidales bacterium]